MLLMLCGMARGGKDHAAEYLSKHIGLDFRGSSKMASELFLYDILKEKYNYSSPEECFEDRINHREEWYELIFEYNLEDNIRLVKDIYSISSTYVGLRSYNELEVAKEYYGNNLLVIWIDASERVSPEPKESCTVVKEQADIIIENNGTIEEFEKKLHKLAIILKPQFGTRNDNK